MIIMNRYPKNPSSNELSELTQKSIKQSQERRDQKKYDEQMRFAKQIAAVALVGIGAPFAAHGIDRAISQPQEQSAKHAQEAIRANPSITTSFEIASGEKVKVTLPK
jgi:hypothetical protein